ncbi:MAG: electron transfer flavoprotein subunit beta/FixA family protein [Planctomycetes bacterium]|nr:electron transfer flavoprotein subunit beta/FixA family protein [Planctomycetota bacterium]
MKIVVCLKQVPEDFQFDTENNTVVRENRKQITNPSDLWAMEMALDIKDKTGAEVVALSMGKPFAASMLKSMAALGADKLYLISDHALAGSDTLATASVLGRAIENIGNVDLVLCGRRTIDGETGQVGPELAVMLNMPCLTNVSGLEAVSGSHIVCRRLLEDRYEVFRLLFPCLLSCCDGVTGIVHPRMSGIAGLRRAKETPVVTMTLADFPGLETFGVKGSPTQVRQTIIPQEKTRKCVMWRSLEESVKETVDLIRKIETT